MSQVAVIPMEDGERYLARGHVDKEAFMLGVGRWCGEPITEWTPEEVEHRWMLVEHNVNGYDEWFTFSVDGAKVTQATEGAEPCTYFSF